MHGHEIGDVEARNSTCRLAAGTVYSTYNFEGINFRGMTVTKVFANLIRCMWHRLLAVRSTNLLLGGSIRESSTVVSRCMGIGA